MHVDSLLPIVPRTLHGIPAAVSQQKIADYPAFNYYSPQSAYMTHTIYTRIHILYCDTIYYAYIHNTADSRKKCTDGVTGSQSHRVSSLVVVMAPEDQWCNYYNVHAFWNKNDCKSVMHQKFSPPPPLLTRALSRVIKFNCTMHKEFSFDCNWEGECEKIYIQMYKIVTIHDLFVYGPLP